MIVSFTFDAVAFEEVLHLSFCCVNQGKKIQTYAMEEEGQFASCSLESGTVEQNQKWSISIQQLGAHGMFTV